MLPPALLDLTLLRLIPSASPARLPFQLTYASRRVHTARRMHQATSVAPVSPPFTHALNYPSDRPNHISDELHSRQKMPVAYADLERKVKELADAASIQASDLDPPTYTEDDLLSFYADILALQPQKPDHPYTETKGEDIEQYLMTVSDAEQRLSAVVAEEAPASAEQKLHSNHTNTSRHAYKRVLSHARDAISRIEASREALKVPPKTGSDPPVLPLSILTIKEFQSLSRLCIRFRDKEAAYLTLDLMKRSNLSIPENMITASMKMYAHSGDTSKIEQIIINHLASPPTETQRNLHVQSHLKITPPDQIPTSALDVLHSYESQGLPAPMNTYTSVISSLISTKSSLGRAHAWDLFTHMRYVAHPDPDVLLYTLMIRACASPLNTRSSEPEKALDLWTEMTVDRRLSPTAGSYDAVILACARSGRTTYVNEAFRLAKQMFDAHRDARGESLFVPSRRTFCALLEGTKRTGDLARARWILAQMIMQQNQNESVNEEVMMHVFHAYASYRPPFRRNALSSIGETSTTPMSMESSSTTEVSPTTQKPVTPSDTVPSEETSTFSKTLPQTRAEVIREVQIIFDHILHDKGIKPVISQHPDGDQALPLQEKFTDVELTPRLLNSYLSVRYRHAPLADAYNLYKQIFDECAVHPTGLIYVEALEKCAFASTHERAIALEFGREVWSQWQSLEEQQDNGKALSGRVVERAHIAMIRLLALTRKTDEAMKHLHAFATRYPPSELTTPTPKPELRSTRTSLIGNRPLVRSTSNVEVPDDHVPPLIMFSDIELLHHRLVAEGAKKGVGYLSYLCKAYEGSLRKRRNTALRAKPDPTHFVEGDESQMARLASPSL